MSEQWKYLAEFTTDDIDDIAEPLDAVKDLLAENAALKEYADEGWAWVDEFCELAKTDVFGLRALLKGADEE